MNERRIIRKGFSQRRVQRCGYTVMLTGKRYQISIGNLISANHQVGSYDAVGTTQIVCNEPMTWVAEQTA